MIFFGGLYSAIHNRLIPHWYATCLWYIGSFSFLTSITIFLEWIFGEDFILSYTNIGILGETLLIIALAVTSTIMLCYTAKEDIIESKKRTK